MVILEENHNVSLRPSVDLTPNVDEANTLVNSLDLRKSTNRNKNSTLMVALLTIEKIVEFPHFATGLVTLLMCATVNMASLKILRETKFS